MGGGWLHITFLRAVSMKISRITCVFKDAHKLPILGVNETLEMYGEFEGFSPALIVHGGVVGIGW